MPLSLRLSKARAWPTWAALALTAIGTVGCSADSTRLGQNPFSSPYSAREGSGPGDVTGSAAPAAPAARVEVKPLSTPLPPPPPRVSAITPQEGTIGGGKGLSPYRPNAAPEVTGSLSSGALRPSPVRTAWTRDGGTNVTVAAGETISTVSRRYGVPPAAIRRANGLSTVSLLRVGQRLVIPRRVPSGVATATLTPGHAASTPGGSVHIVAPGETLIKIAKQHHRPLVELARVNNIPPYTKVNLGDRLVIPGAQAQVPAASPPPAQLPAAKGNQVATSEPIHYMVEGPATPAPDKPGKVESTGSLPELRWPVRAKLIAAFGPTTDGQQNDGINLSVPEGTPVKAAEEGVVTYAGSAIKRYGNLVLVRHPNGYSTTYAHLGELLVKRNDTVKRGQVIAHSGQSGGVSSPQLHFEVRKGSTPVDPMPFLDRGTYPVSQL
jgi:murein DD-endopeptidase MepM/ murein hydrolase activator NlpD